MLCVRALGPSCSSAVKRSEYLNLGQLRVAPSHSSPPPTPDNGMLNKQEFICVLRTQKANVRLSCGRGGMVRMALEGSAFGTKRRQPALREG